MSIYKFLLLYFNTNRKENPGIIFLALIFFLSSCGPHLLSQSLTGNLQGKVTSEKGEPLIGTNVRILELNIGSSSNNDGKYVIEKYKGRFL